MTDPSRPVLRLVPGGVVEDVAGGDPSAWMRVVDAQVARLGSTVGPALPGRWETVRALARPDDLDRLTEHAASLHDAAAIVRRQHTETAEDLGPLWDTWDGPAAEAVQDRVSALARSAHALVVELEDTAAEIVDAHDRVVEALATLAGELDEHEPPDPVAACDRAAATCTEAWAQARQVLAGGSPGGAVSGSYGPRCP